MKTTFQEMLDGILDLEWSVSSTGAIRCANGLCPIVAAAKELAREEFEGMDGTWGDEDYDLAADVLGLTIDREEFIIAVDDDEDRIRHTFAYDGQKRGHLLRTRRRVLKALGLTEQRV